jgi:hypothetical protein
VLIICFPVQARTDYRRSRPIRTIHWPRTLRLDDRAVIQIAVRVVALGERRGVLLFGFCAYGEQRSNDVERVNDSI